jgi:very-short-patch-repair endonuclease
MKQVGGRKWRRQVPIGPYIVDFFCPQLRLVVEIDGETHVDSLTGDTLTAWLAARGSIVLRCWNNNVLSNLSGVLVLIAAHPSPNPLPEGEGVRNRQT